MVTENSPAKILLSVLHNGSNITPAMPGKNLSGKASVQMLSANCKALKIYQKVPALRRPATSDFSVYPKSLWCAPKQFKNLPVMYDRKASTDNSSTCLFMGNKQRASTQGPYGMESQEYSKKYTTASETKAGLKKVTTVFLSEKQSQYMKDGGILMPSAPPATPTPGSFFFSGIHVCVCEGETEIKGV